MMVWVLKSKAMAHQWLLSCVGESVGLSGNMRRSSVLSGILRMADVWSMLDILGRCLVGRRAKLSDEVRGCNVHAGTERGGCAECCALWGDKLI